MRSVRAGGQNGNTVLIQAAIDNNLPVVEALIALNANINARNVRLPSSPHPLPPLPAALGRVSRSLPVAPLLARSAWEKNFISFPK